LIRLEMFHCTFGGMMEETN